MATPLPLYLALAAVSILWTIGWVVIGPWFQYAYGRGHAVPLFALLAIAFWTYTGYASQAISIRQYTGSAPTVTEGYSFLVWLSTGMVVLSAGALLLWHFEEYPPRDTPNQRP